MVANIVVLGAGVVGLSTAINIQKVIPSAKVTVIADKFDEDTTTYGSGGLFVPTLSEISDTPPETYRKWIDTSWDQYRQLVTGPEAGDCGGIIITGYYVSRTEYKDPSYKDVVFSYRKISDTELQKLGLPSRYKHGYSVTTLLFYPRKYLKWLHHRFVSNGGRTKQHKVRSIEEFVGKYDVVVNCTGLGSRILAADDKVHPIRGQIVRIKAPWIKHWIYTDDIAYIIPGEDVVGLGGIKQPDNYNMAVDIDDTKDILTRCEQVLPSIKGASVDHVWVGLRPGRDSVRLELETMAFKTGSIKVVHNYGHGSNGVALSWGTAVQAALLVAAFLSRTPAKL